MDFDIELSTQILARTPGALHALLDGLPDPWTRAGEGPDTFSPFDVVGHLIDGEETDWIPRARIILAQARIRSSNPTTASGIAPGTSAASSAPCSRNSLDCAGTIWCCSARGI